MSRRQRLAALTAANSADLIRAFGLPAHPVAGALLWPPARRFARQLLEVLDLGRELPSSFDEEEGEEVYGGVPEEEMPLRLKR